MNNLQSLSFYFPELTLTIVILAAIIYDLFIDKSKSYRVGWILCSGLVIVSFLIWKQGNSTTTLFTDAIALDPFSSFFKQLIILSTILICIVSLISKELADYRKGEYFALLGIITFGLFMMVSAIDLIILYISIEIVSIMSFVLAGYLKKDTFSNEASLKYVLYGALSSGIMLFGLSYIFGLTGSTNFFVIQNTISGLDESSNTILLLSMIMILAGFGYKISAVPFHFWTPDVYQGSPTAITAYLSIAPKAGAFAMMIRFSNQVFADGGAFLGSEILSLEYLPWSSIISLLAVLTMTLGNIVALQQNNIKRMLAYSSVAHAGYMLLAMPAMSSDAIYAIMLYLVMYMFMNLGAFFVIILVKNKTGGETFDDYKGLGWEMPTVGVCMTIFMVSLTGLPPTAGFIGKFYIFAALVKGGNSFYWLVFAGGINSVVSLYYYLKVVKVMFFEGGKKDVILKPDLGMSSLLLATAVPSIILGIYWSPLASWIENSLHFFIQTI